jgi:hypothetical protein
MRTHGPRLALAAFALALAGCLGAGGSQTSLDINQVPLVSGASVVAHARQCDEGANAFCAFEAVVVDPRYNSSGALVASEHRQLRKFGWSSMAGDDGDERAAESPGHKLRITYATAANDLTGIDEKWIKRPASIGLALSRTMFSRTAAMSVMLEVGPT